MFHGSSIDGDIHFMRDLKANIKFGYLYLCIGRKKCSEKYLEIQKLHYKCPHC